MRSRLITRLAAARAAAGARARPPALAHNDGRGFYGATNDKVVTDAGLRS